MKTIGRIITGLPVLFLAFDGAVKLANPSFVTEASAKLGLPAGISVGLGIVLLASLALYLARRTALLGAVLLTGYLGGPLINKKKKGDRIAKDEQVTVYV